MRNLDLELTRQLLGLGISGNDFFGRLEKYESQLIVLAKLKLR